MIKRIDIGAMRFTWSIATVIKVVGVNSYLDDGSHILMWDFDDVPLEDIKHSLKIVQARYLLSDIYILETKQNENYCAYCFTAVDWRRAVEILAATNYLDMKYLKWCLFRGRFTLRVGSKMGRTSHCVSTLEGYQLPDATIDDLKSWVIYETMGGKEYWTRLTRKWQDWLTHLTCRLKQRLLMRSGRKLLKRN